MDDRQLPAMIDHARQAMGEGDFAEARASYRDAARAAYAAERINEQAYCLRHAAQASLDLGEYSHALSDATEAARLYREMGGEAGLNHANALRLEALALEGMGQIGDARPHWESARAIYREQGIGDGVAECEQHLTA